MLREALDSLLAQSMPADEIIVINDASTDDTASILAGYGSRLRVIDQPANQGKPVALNLAIPQAVGDYVWLFDDDDVALADALASHLDFLRLHPDIEFTYSDKYRYTNHGDIWTRDLWQLDRMTSVKPEAFLMRTMLSMNTLMQGMLIPKQTLIDIGLFNESLDRCEDHDMIMRLAADYRGANLGKPTFVYREHAGARGAGQKSHAAQMRFRVMADYRRQVFRKLRSQLPLDRYLMHRQASPVWKNADGLEAAALVQRACIMLRHGLISEGAADLEAGLSNPAIAQVDNRWLNEVFAQSLDAEPWIFQSRRGLAGEITHVLARNQRLEHGSAFMRGMYWHMRRALSRRQPSQVLASGALLSTFGATWLSRRLLLKSSKIRS